MRSSHEYCNVFALLTSLHDIIMSVTYFIIRKRGCLCARKRLTAYIIRCESAGIFSSREHRASTTLDPNFTSKSFVVVKNRTSEHAWERMFKGNVAITSLQSHRSLSEKIFLLFTDKMMKTKQLAVINSPNKNQRILHIFLWALALLFAQTNHLVWFYDTKWIITVRTLLVGRSPA